MAFEVDLAENDLFKPHLDLIVQHGDHFVFPLVKLEVELICKLQCSFVVQVHALVSVRRTNVENRSVVPSAKLSRS